MSSSSSLNPLLETWLVAGREVRKSLRSGKGVALLVLSIAFGALAALVLLKLQAFRQESMANATPEMVQQLRQTALTRAYGDEETGAYLAQAPDVLLVAFHASVWFTPALVALLGFDVVAGELQHRTVRYFTVRLRRGAYLAGKALGLFGTVAVVTCMMHVFVALVSIARGEPPLPVLTWGPRLFLVTLPLTAAWCGLATLVSSWFRAPGVALLSTFAVFFAVWLAYAIGSAIGGVWQTVGSLVYPNAYDAWLLSAHAGRAAMGLGAAAAYLVATVGGGALLFAERDL